MSTASASQLYGRYAGFYDFFFRFSLPGRAQTIRRMDPQPGERILEIGVGTGLSFPHYPAGVELTGIDLSIEMLLQAQQRVERSGRTNTQLFQMNAQQMDFADNRFDHSVAMYVASVTPNATAMVKEMQRVTKPGGHLYILNHFSRKGSWLHMAEKSLSIHAKRIGWEPLFYLDEFLSSARIENAKDIPIRPFGYWRLLEIENNKS